MLLIIFVMVAIPAIGGWYLVRGKNRSVSRLQGQVNEDVRKRLESIASEVGGTITPEPALILPSGKVTLFASKAPESFVIDTAKFVAPTPALFPMTIVRVEDAKKVVSSKGLIALKSAESKDQQTHVFFASDEPFGRRCMEPELVDALRSLDRKVRGRCRVMMAKGTLAIVLARGLAEPEELVAFCQGCAAVASRIADRSRRVTG
ncbi:MAG TPA: hypothetical protein VG457_20245 [Planctomycetota bacterium]|nr:hypothetical protein [Planctomycetota bacterium]